MLASAPGETLCCALLDIFHLKTRQTNAILRQRLMVHFISLIGQNSGPGPMPCKSWPRFSSQLITRPKSKMDVSNTVSKYNSNVATCSRVQVAEYRCSDRFNEFLRWKSSFRVRVRVWWCSWLGTRTKTLTHTRLYMILPHRISNKDWFSDFFLPLRCPFFCSYFDQAACLCLVTGGAEHTANLLPYSVGLRHQKTFPSLKCLPFVAFVAGKKIIKYTVDLNIPFLPESKTKSAISSL